VHLRRALLLFAIVLGMAALVASLSRPIDDRRAQSTTPTETEPGPPTVTPGTAPAEGGSGAPATVTFQASRDESRKLEAGRAATVLVEVAEAGSVEIPDMGLTAAADAVTPARFDVLATRPGRYPLLFTSARGEKAKPAGSLVVTSRG
jgi:hypothetical protein